MVFDGSLQTAALADLLIWQPGLQWALRAWQRLVEGIKLHFGKLGSQMMVEDWNQQITIKEDLVILIVVGQNNLKQGVDHYLKSKQVKIKIWAKVVFEWLKRSAIKRIKFGVGIEVEPYREDDKYFILVLRKF